jgi:O-methyltransferase
MEKNMPAPRWKDLVKLFLRKRGYSLVRSDSLPPEVPPDLSAEEVEIYKAVKPYTMTSAERIAALVQSVRYVVSARIDGAIVECGVWRGGSMMAVASKLLQMGVTDRELFLFDTFAGMPEPGPGDVDFLNRSGSALMNEARTFTQQQQLDSYLFAYSPLEAVKRNLGNSQYPIEKTHFVQGKVEDTIPEHAPDKIALLRLDTDWYESTRHEMLHLFPRLSSGGVVIIDDYGHWQGARRAVDEYFQQTNTSVLLNRIDYTARSAIKP